MTDWQRQRATELLHISKDAIGGAYEKISDKTAVQLEGLGDVEVQRLTKSVDHSVGVELSAKMSPQQLESIAGAKQLLIQGAVQKTWWAKHVEELHAAVRDNVAIPVKAKADGEAGLSLGERNILSATAACAQARPGLGGGARFQYLQRIQTALTCPSR